MMKEQIATVAQEEAASGVLRASERVDAPDSRHRAREEFNRPRRLRARRVRADELQLDGLEASGRHAILGDVRAVVEDLSLTGAALWIAGGAAKSSLVLNGDRLERLQLVCRGALLYEGDAHVRRVTERGNDLIIGVEVQERTIDLSELYRLGTKHSFSERLYGLFEPQEDDVSDAFKVWVNDLRGSLERIKSFLDAEEAALDNLDLFTREETLKTYLESTAPRLIEKLNAASSELFTLVSNLSEEQHSIYRNYYKRQMSALIVHSPLLKRAYTKPLGYAGDYEMMNMIYRNHAEGDSLFGRALNLYAAQEQAAQATINRVDYLSKKICQAIEVRGRVRLASIGCGPAHELFVLLQRHPELGPYMDVALIDQEERGLVYCERTLSPLAIRTGAKVHFIKESVRRLLTAKKLKEALGERDFIYSAGLFDYLNARSFSTLLAVLYEALAPSGHLAIGNFAGNNPSRYFMEYCLDWFLIHRTRQDLLSFVPALSPAPARAEVDAEPSGVNLFLLIWK
jgi:extracellular factor (EF) 3-hydroxypalmitic acid methyl ester biosynthesis protein